MLSYRPEIAQKLRQAANAVERIGRLIEHERVIAACQEAAAILHECASELAPPAPSPPPDRAKRHAAGLAGAAKPTDD